MLFYRIRQSPNLLVDSIHSCSFTCHGENPSPWQFKRQVKKFLTFFRNLRKIRKSLRVIENVVEYPSKRIDSEMFQLTLKYTVIFFYINSIVVQETSKWKLPSLHKPTSIPLARIMSHYTLNVCNAEIIPKLIY